MIKKFVPCIYLYREHAVRSFDDRTIVETDPLRLVRKFCENHADELIVFDLSEEEYESVAEADAAHEAALDMLKQIAQISEVDVYAGGNIHRMEDVKKILYTGCKKAILDYTKPENVELTREVSEKFGADKLLASLADPEELVHLMDEQKLLSGFLLLNPHKIRETQEATCLPFYVQIGQVALNKLLEIFAYDSVCGVTGNTINDNAEEILSLKELCRENGLKVALLESSVSWEQLKKNEQGLVPVVVQDYRNNEVLMVAYMNEKAFHDTLLTGMMNYYSRSRDEQWLKGDTSGHYQYVKSLTADCDFDTILAKVSQVGAACHTGARSCFFNEITSREYTVPENPLTVFQDVFDTIMDRKEHPKEGSYTNYLFDKGIDKILKKVGEEATEIVIAAKNPNPNEIVYEISDFLYHVMVLMADKGVTWEEVTAELANRH